MESEHRAVTISDVKGFDSETRSATHLISTERLDRAGDIVSVAGWTTENYSRNPVVLQNHSYKVEDIIGRGSDLHVTKGRGLYATTTFAETPTAKVAFDLVRSGFSAAWSVGFAPKRSHTYEQGSTDKCETCRKALGNGAPAWGRHFIEQDLLEYSLVAVPMNPDAVTYAVKRGLLPESMVARFVAPDEEAETRGCADVGVKLSTETVAAIERIVREVGRQNAIADLRDRARRIREGNNGR